MISFLTYPEALDAQKSSRNSASRWLLFVAPPTITVGLRDCALDVLAPETVLRQEGIVLLKTDRGGRATYHGPGQIVVFPVGRLEDFGMGSRDARAFVTTALKSVSAFAENEIARTQSAPLSVHSIADGADAGIWMGEKKVSSFGLKFSREGIGHGFALNLDPRAQRGFSHIRPCGLDSEKLGSLFDAEMSEAALSSLADRLRKKLDSDFHPQ